MENGSKENHPKPLKTLMSCEQSLFVVGNTGTRFIHGSTLFTYTIMCRDERLKNEKQQCAVFNNETQYVLEVRMGRHGDKYAPE